jgi:hypothetical protein
MASSGMLRRVALVRTDVSEELSASFIRVTGIVVPSSPILVTLMEEAVSSSKTSVLIRATRRNSPEDAILHSHRRGNLESYIPRFLVRIPNGGMVSSALQWAMNDSRFSQFLNSCLIPVRSN